MTQIAIQLLGYAPNKSNSYIRELNEHQSAFLESNLLNDPVALRQDISMAAQPEFYQEPPLEKLFLYLSHQLWHHKTNTLHQALLKNLYTFELLEQESSSPGSQRLRLLHLHWVRSYIINIINTMDVSREKTMVVKIKSLKTYLDSLNLEMAKMEKTLKKNGHQGEVFNKDCFQVLNQNWETHFQQRRSDLISLFNNLKAQDIISHEDGQEQDMDLQQVFPSMDLKQDMMEQDMMEQDKEEDSVQQEMHSMSIQMESKKKRKNVKMES